MFHIITAITRSRRKHERITSFTALIQHIDVDYHKYRLQFFLIKAEAPTGYLQVQTACGGFYCFIYTPDVFLNIHEVNKEQKDSPGIALLQPASAHLLLTRH